MRHTPAFEMTDPEQVRQLIREHPWAILVSSTSAGLVASHYPVLVSGEGDEIVIDGHVGRPDELLHELGQHEVLMIFQGPHGYVSSSWYDDEPAAVPTWNFVTAHLSGTPQILSHDENLVVLERLTDHFEATMAHPRLMRGSQADSDYADRIAKGTVGFRVRVNRWVAKNKMSQNRSDATAEHIMHEIAAGSPYADPALAAEMRRTRDGSSPRPASETRSAPVTGSTE